MWHCRLFIGIGLLAVLTLNSKASGGCFVNNDLSGQVLDYRDSLPIQGALVCLYSQCWDCGSADRELFALTDASGRFKIADCCTLYFPTGPVGGFVHYFAVAAGYDTADVSHHWDQLGCPEDFDFTFGPNEYTFYLRPQTLSVNDNDDRAPMPDLNLASHPNPFNAATTISFELVTPAEVSISLVDVGGRAVRHLKEGLLPGGAHQLMWDGRDDTGAPVASGVYFCRLFANKHKYSLKLLLLK